jgi:hypothetical protein
MLAWSSASGDNLCHQIKVEPLESFARAEKIAGTDNPRHEQARRLVRRVAGGGRE